MRKVVVGSTERGILYKDKRFVAFLQPGTYRYVSLINTYTVDVIDIAKNPELKGGIAQLILKEFNSTFDDILLKVTTGPREVGVVYMNDRANRVLAPGEERLFWKGLYQTEVKKFDISNSYEIDRETLRDLSCIQNDEQVLSVQVPEQSSGILMDAGVIVKELQPGTYGFWKSQRKLNTLVLDKRLTALEVSGQEMLTKDKVSLRVNLTVSYRLVDSMKAVKALSDIQGEIYRSAQLGLRQIVGEKTLDELLENKEFLNRNLLSDLTSAMGSFGVEFQRVGVKDIILPGDMRTLLNKVVEAEKAAQAQNIRRREETAATRSLLNTARMIENNPVMLKLKELEAVERVSEKVGQLTVLDGFEGVMKGLFSFNK